jgi:hypothetical protein
MDKIDGRTREARAMRSEEIRSERRRRSDNLGRPMNLATEGELDRDRYEYRWINDDEKARLHRMTVNDDWSIVTTSGDGVTLANVKETNLGDAVTRVVGAKKDGSPLKSYLCRKPREWAEEDRSKKAARLKDAEDAIKRGRYSEDGRMATDPNFYNPDNRRNIIEQR